MKGAVEILGAEKYPGHTDEEIRQKSHRQADRRPLKKPLSCAQGVKHSLNDEIEAMQSSPDHKSPRCSMPEPADQHSEHQVHVGAHGALTIAAESNIQIITEPGRKGNVPPAPEIGKTNSGIRKMKIVFQDKPQAQRYSDRTSRVPREVEENLAGEGERANPGVYTARLFPPRIDHVCNRRKE